MLHEDGVLASLLVCQCRSQCAVDSQASRYVCRQKLMTVLLHHGMHLQILLCVNLPAAVDFFTTSFACKEHSWRYSVKPKPAWTKALHHKW